MCCAAIAAAAAGVQDKPLADPTGGALPATHPPDFLAACAAAGTIHPGHTTSLSALTVLHTAHSWGWGLFVACRPCQVAALSNTTTPLHPIQVTCSMSSPRPTIPPTRHLPATAPRVSCLWDQMLPLLALHPLLHAVSPDTRLCKAPLPGKGTGH